MLCCLNLWLSKLRRFLISIHWYYLNTSWWQGEYFISAGEQGPSFKSESGCLLQLLAA